MALLVAVILTERDDRVRTKRVNNRPNRLDRLRGPCRWTLLGGRKGDRDDQRHRDDCSANGCPIFHGM